MIETRSQRALKDPITGDVSSEECESGGTLDSRIELMIKRTQALEISVAEQNKEMRRDMADLFTMIKMLPGTQGSSGDKQHQTKGPPGASTSTDLMGDNGDLNRGVTSILQQHYSDITMVGKWMSPGLMVLVFRLGCLK